MSSDPNRIENKDLGNFGFLLDFGEKELFEIGRLAEEYLNTNKLFCAMCIRALTEAFFNTVIKNNAIYKKQKAILKNAKEKELFDIFPPSSGMKRKKITKDWDEDLEGNNYWWYGTYGKPSLHNKPSRVDCPEGKGDNKWNRSDDPNLSYEKWTLINPNTLYVWDAIRRLGNASIYSGKANNEWLYDKYLKVVIDQLYSRIKSYDSNNNDQPECQQLIASLQELRDKHDSNRSCAQKIRNITDEFFNAVIKKYNITHENNASSTCDTIFLKQSKIISFFSNYKIDPFYKKNVFPEWCSKINEIEEFVKEKGLNNLINNKTLMECPAGEGVYIDTYKDEKGNEQQTKHYVAEDQNLLYVWDAIRRLGNSGAHDWEELLRQGNTEAQQLNHIILNLNKIPIQDNADSHEPKEQSKIWLNDDKYLKIAIKQLCNRISAYYYHFCEVTDHYDYNENKFIYESNKTYYFNEIDESTTTDIYPMQYQEKLYSYNALTNISNLSEFNYGYTLTRTFEEHKKDLTSCKNIYFKIENEKIKTIPKLEFLSNNLIAYIFDGKPLDLTKDNLSKSRIYADIKQLYSFCLQLLNTIHELSKIKIYHPQITNKSIKFLIQDNSINVKIIDLEICERESDSEKKSERLSMTIRAACNILLNLLYPISLSASNAEETIKNIENLKLDEINSDENSLWSKTSPDYKNEAIDLARHLIRLREGKIDINKVIEILKHRIKPDSCYIISSIVEPVRNFKGREQELKDLHDALDKNRIVVLHGAPGIGKSAIARQYINQHQTDYDTILFVSGDSFFYYKGNKDPLKETKKNNGIVVEIIIGYLVGKDPLIDAIADNQLIQIINFNNSDIVKRLDKLKEFSIGNNTLFVIDNFDINNNKGVFSDFLKNLINYTQDNFKFVITLENEKLYLQRLKDIQFKKLHIKEIPIAELSDLFCYWYGYPQLLTTNNKSIESNAINEIINLTNSNTMLLELVANFAKNKGILPSKLLEKLKNNPIDSLFNSYLNEKDNKNKKFLLLLLYLLPLQGSPESQLKEYFGFGEQDTNDIDDLISLRLVIRRKQIRDNTLINVIANNSYANKMIYNFVQSMQNSIIAETKCKISDRLNNFIYLLNDTNKDEHSIFANHVLYYWSDWILILKENYEASAPNYYEASAHYYNYDNPFYLNIITILDPIAEYWKKQKNLEYSTYEKAIIDKYSEAIFIKPKLTLEGTCKRIKTKTLLFLISMLPSEGFNIKDFTKLFGLNENKIIKDINFLSAYGLAECDGTNIKPKETVSITVPELMTDIKLYSNAKTKIDKRLQQFKEKEGTRPPWYISYDPMNIQDPIVIIRDNFRNYFLNLKKINIKLTDQEDSFIRTWNKFFINTLNSRQIIILLFSFRSISIERLTKVLELNAQDVNKDIVILCELSLIRYDEDKENKVKTYHSNLSDYEFSEYFRERIKLIDIFNCLDNYYKRLENYYFFYYKLLLPESNEYVLSPTNWLFEYLPSFLNSEINDFIDNNLDINKIKILLLISMIPAKGLDINVFAKLFGLHEDDINEDIEDLSNLGLAEYDGTNIKPISYFLILLLDEIYKINIDEELTAFVKAHDELFMLNNSAEIVNKLRNRFETIKQNALELPPKEQYSRELLENYWMEIRYNEYFEKLINSFSDIERMDNNERNKCIYRFFRPDVANIVSEIFQKSINENNNTEAKELLTILHNNLLSKLEEERQQRLKQLSELD